jgi:hemoglobin-like flavoprotein
VKRMLFGRRSADVDEQGQVQQAIVNARKPEAVAPSDPPQWESVTSEPWGDAVTEEIDRIRAEEERVDDDRVQNTRRAVDPGPADSGVHALPSPVRGVRVGCHECEGRGYVVKPVKELLQESLGLIPEGKGDAVVAEFYRRLIDADNGKPSEDHIASLFPSDLLSAADGEVDSRGAQQRDRLFKALAALADLYNPDDPAAMERLDHALGAYGRSHAPFLRPDGSVRGATLQEYAAVQFALIGTFRDAGGPGWHPEYDRAWVEAYDYAAAKMMVEQHRVTISGEFTMGRMPRHDR